MLVIKNIFSQAIALLSILMSIEGIAQEQNGGCNIHLSVVSGDSLCQLDSVSFGLSINYASDQGWSWAEKHFFKVIGIELIGDIDKNVFDKLSVFQKDDYLNVEMYFYNITDLCSHFQNLIGLLDSQLQKFEKTEYYQRDENNCVNALGQNWHYFHNGYEKNVQVFIEITELPSGSQLNSNKWEVRDNVRIVLRKFDL